MFAFANKGNYLITLSGQRSKTVVQLWDAFTSVPLSPPIRCYSSKDLIGDQHNKWIPYRLSRDEKTLMTFPIKGGSQSSKETEVACRLSIWDISPCKESVDQLEQLAQLYSGCSIAATGIENKMQLAEYQALWRKVREGYANWFDSESQDPPDELPRSVNEKETVVEKPELRADFSLFKDPQLARSNPKIIPFVDALTDKSKSIRQAALRSLKDCKLPRDIRVGLLAQGVLEKDMRHDAADTLGRMGPEAAGAVRQLVSVLENGTHDVDVIWALGRIGPAARDALPLLAQVINKKSGNRSEAARAIRRIDPSYVEVIPGLIEMMEDFPHMRNAAEVTIQEIAEAAPEKVVPFLVAEIETKKRSWTSDSVLKRVKAAEVLAMVGPKGKPAIQPLRGLAIQRTTSTSVSCIAGLCVVEDYGE